MILLIKHSRQPFFNRLRPLRIFFLAFLAVNFFTFQYSLFSQCSLSNFQLFQLTPCPSLWKRGGILCVIFQFIFLRRIGEAANHFLIALRPLRIFFLADLAVNFFHSPFTIHFSPFTFFLRESPCFSSVFSV